MTKLNMASNAFQRGVVNGFASPLFFFGYQNRSTPKASVSTAWKNVGRVLKDTEKRECADLEQAASEKGANLAIC